MAVDGTQNTVETYDSLVINTTLCRLLKVVISQLKETKILNLLQYIF